MTHQPPSVRFINTYPPVTPTYENSAAAFHDLGWRPRFLILDAGYRSGQTHDLAESDCEIIYTSRWMRKQRSLLKAWYALAAAWTLLARPASAHIFLSQPPLFFIIGAWISRMRGVPYVLHVMDLYPDFLNARGFLHRDGWLYRLLDRFARSAFHHAAGTIVIGRCMRGRLIEKGVSPQRIAVQGNWAFSAVHPVETQNNPLAGRYNLAGAFVVLYAGNMGHGHDLTTLLEAARRLRHRHDIRFVFIGSGFRRRDVEACIQQGAANAMLYDYPEPNENNFALSLGDVHFVSLAEGFEGVMVPSKMFSAMAAARAILYEGAASTETALLIEEYDCGRVIPHGDADALSNTIEELAGDREKARRMGANGRAAIETRLNPSVRGREYAECVLRLARGDE